MATHKSASKSHRASERRREVNKKSRSRLRGALKSIRTAAESGDTAKARTLLPGTLALIDRSVGKRVLHANAGARHKSRITRLVNSRSAK